MPSTAKIISKMDWAYMSSRFQLMSSRFRPLLLSLRLQVQSAVIRPVESANSWRHKLLLLWGEKGRDRLTEFLERESDPVPVFVLSRLPLTLGFPFHLSWTGSSWVGGWKGGVAVLLRPAVSSLCSPTGILGSGASVTKDFMVMGSPRRWLPEK